jgi:hypothetical protein
MRQRILDNSDYGTARQASMIQVGGAQRSEFWRMATAKLGRGHGVGVSVGRWFRNINWVAVPGYKLFFQGDINPGETLTQEHTSKELARMSGHLSRNCGGATEQRPSSMTPSHFAATVRDAVDKQIYKGVDFHDYPNASDGGSLEDFIAKQGIGTDFALNFARAAFCARIPVTERMLDEV